MAGGGSAAVCDAVGNGVTAASVVVGVGGVSITANKINKSIKIMTIKKNSNNT